MSEQNHSWPELGIQHSAAFERFRDSLDMPIRGRDGLDSLDLEALRQLRGQEREHAEELLITRLQIDSDGRVADALAELGSTRAIEPLKRRLYRVPPGSARVAVARALRRLDSAHADAEPIIEILRTGSWSQRADAASSLRSFATVEAQDALRQALGDEHALVRLNALDAIYDVAGLSPLAQTPFTLLGMLRARIGSSLVSLQQGARDELDDILARLHQDASPEALGLAQAVDPESEPIRRFRDSRLSGEPQWQHDFDLEALSLMTESERAWAMYALLTARHLDGRALRALKVIGNPKAIEPLHEWMASIREPILVSEAASTIQHLSARPGPGGPA